MLLKGEVKVIVIYMYLKLIIIIKFNIGMLYVYKQKLGYLFFSYMIF